MKYKHWFGELTFITMSFLLFIVGCSDGSQEVDSPMGTVSFPLIASTTATSLTLTPTPVATSLLSDTPLPTQTPLPTPTALPTETMTPLPTLSSQETLEAVRDLFENNAGCRLPCWWGIIPGETQWAKAQSFLSPFASGVFLNGSWNDPVYYMDVTIPVPPEIFPIPLRQRYTVKDDMVEMIETQVGNIENYYLYQFLTSYGQPSEIWISTYSEPREGSLPFSTVLFYSQQGIMIEYGSEADKEGENVVACVYRYFVGANLVAWSPGEEVTFEELMRKINEARAIEGLNYMQLGSATGVDVSTFYETFRNAESTVCLETPSDLWSSP